MIMDVEKCAPTLVGAFLFLGPPSALFGGRELAPAFLPTDTFVRHMNLSYYGKQRMEEKLRQAAALQKKPPLLASCFVPGLIL